MLHPGSQPQHCPRPEGAQENMQLLDPGVSSAVLPGHKQAVSPLEMLIRRSNKVSQDAPLIADDRWYPAETDEPQSDGFGGYLPRQDTQIDQAGGSQGQSGGMPMMRGKGSGSNGSSGSISYIQGGSYESSTSLSSRKGQRNSNGNATPSTPLSQNTYEPSSWQTQERLAPQPGDGDGDSDIFIVPNAFRSSVASDISYNSITVDEEKRKLHKSFDWDAVRQDQQLQRTPGEQTGRGRMERRNSSDTVCSSEFGEQSRWGHLWAGKPHDEGSTFLMSRDSELEQEAMDLKNWHVDIGGGEGVGHQTLQGLDALRELARGIPVATFSACGGVYSHSAHIAQRKQAYPVGPDGTGVHRPLEGQRAQLVNSRQTGEHSGKDRSQVVSFSGSIHEVVPVNGPNDVDEREQHCLFAATLRSEHSSSQERSRDRDSVLTIRGSASSEVPLSLNIWPPTPEGSINGSQRQWQHNGRAAVRHSPTRDAQAEIVDEEAASLYKVESFAMNRDQQRNSHRESAVSLTTDGSGSSGGSSGKANTCSSGDDDFRTPLQGPTSIISSLPVSGSMASPAQINGVSTFPSARPLQQHPFNGPVGVAQALQNPLHTPLVGPGAASHNQLDVHGRLDTGHHGRHAAPHALPDLCSNPNLPPGILPGSRRAKAIADHDGRESMVSDLDVETLRLDGSGSSRRDSFSTIRSAMTVGTINYDSERQAIADAYVLVDGQRNGITAAQSLQQEWVLEQQRSLHQQQFQNGRSPYRLHSAASTSTPSFATDSSTVKSSQSSMLRDPDALAKRSQLGADTKTGPAVAEEYLSQGITYHEQGDMSRSAFYFERSAKAEGGCVVGMCMWGMALREGWGARKDPRKGFEWIQMAAARAGKMSNNPTRSEGELKAIKSELKLSVYELGKCYCYGWGTKMDKQTALEYFELAAKLGDVDAQAEAGALYTAGKGCKKDLKKAAMYYRLAEKQGYDTVGLSWIWKDKYNA
ncbi:hypothetical protein K437DRAFT_295478 [Tilletiaria anomala UBC 951]|uniref:HCP-like protein n=1 Tax=Tilletiaria anomala (strain ATCC 24038 / CBS 436.72 / UBC 951) TaxID=1037660 RepID=A0A066VTJ3_TILAU|nr:uncharacterized protein K437DRAFT_295478 [Tilletiaria anomala UBC 951]KDN41855.1 hypothetical protein K437DRAFT_295478 [Tilletiaria anomala UBC 951]